MISIRSLTLTLVGISVSTSLYANKLPDTEKSEIRAYKYQVMYGLTYSNYTTTTGVANFGRYFSLYRRFNVLRETILYIGFNYSSKKPDMLNKLIRSSLMGNGGTTLSTSDILGKYKFIEITSVLGYQLINTEAIHYRQLIGIGYALNIRSTANIRVNSQIKSEDGNPFHVFDYTYADGSPLAMWFNKGLVFHLGSEIEFGRYLLNLMYSYNLFYLKWTGMHLSLGDPGERLHSIALIIGVGL